MKDAENIVGVLLAGGLAKRMGGGDKCLQLLSGKTLLSYTIGVASDQVDHLIINAAGDSSRFGKFNLPVVVKADCLAAGKGVVICKTKKKAFEISKKIFEGKFKSSKKIVL